MKKILDSYGFIFGAGLLALFLTLAGIVIYKTVKDNKIEEPAPKNEYAITDYVITNEETDYFVITTPSIVYTLPVDTPILDESKTIIGSVKYIASSNTYICEYAEQEEIDNEAE